MLKAAIFFVFVRAALGEFLSDDYPLWETLEDIGLSKRSGSAFSYEEGSSNGPSNWGSVSPNCNGVRQSPININVLKAKYGYGLPPLVIEGFEKQPSSVVALNNGHSFVIKFNYADGVPAKFTGGPLKTPYIIDGIHWHWGDNDRKGSEHTFNGLYLAAEGHIVSYNSKYGSLAEAVKNPDGLAVLGVFYKWSIYPTDLPFIRMIKNVIQPKIPYTETAKVFTIKDVIKRNNFNIFTYPGSLTTPNCNEVVTWMVSNHYVSINSNDLAELRKILDEEGKPLKKNYRPIQNRNNRVLTVI